MTYNAICPKCDARFSVPRLTGGFIVIERCKSCPPAVMMQGMPMNSAETAIYNFHRIKRRRELRDMRLQKGTVSRSKSSEP